MDDEEEDMLRPISQLRGTPFGNLKFEERATQFSAGQSVSAVTSQSHDNNNTLPCGPRRQPHVPFHGNAGLRPHFPAQFEPMEDRGERQVEEAEEDGERGQDDRMEHRRLGQEGLSVEAQIGRKLREIGDKFNEDHIEVFLRQQRQNLPAWMRLTLALFGVLFPGQPPAPRLRAEQR
ncbi:BCL2 modifying factor 2 isoform X1 [Synchiropus splendidus]|uniref:BCL2 modifying factor 2 isoform X1 n=1 Tax=Synchiropus splendidus TaxID=270530 RepID=UPI00237E5318|nr:BCL2 modifying factor 2 isoform X1 [Synchiropus splendidus]XP_053737771.1 BCL2 modifying factor 2 isoform X1 [Synchiropus splendidus]XP_053737772.1 BCL2 modifying factor 2 isoform X1 [Synchiropus splendidus]XP_053737773.1 BCL2 modifying factor 2 isoform X1 [Synchiropus splendidus]XP_053737774.1 BCL2 modifying factor 2 isoform X1 [Synchiropus splendidus]XP_053737775.1 BCL2 modifying factor 2 isoform X1 [Synchiropus splendidus]